MKRKLIIGELISIILISLCTLYLYYENNALMVSNYTIVNKKIPSAFDNYKIIQISDFHNTKSEKLTNDLVKEIEKNKPNIIVLTGDLIDANKTDIETSISLIKRINKLAPIYFVSGNHEASIDNYDELKEKLIANKVIILDGKLEIIKIDNNEINLLGIDDPKMSHNSYQSDLVVIQDELTPIEYDRNNFSILLSHRSELIEKYAENEMDLVLTGHAHGGQIKLPFVGGLVAPNQGIFPKYTTGVYEKNNTKMIVSKGIGNSILPFRINNRPELIVVTLNSK